jgi:hypothetical protein
MSEENEPNQHQHSDPRREEWLVHDGGDVPVRAHVEVQVRFRNGQVSEPVYAAKRRWKAWPADIGDSDWDIVAWRPVEPGSVVSNA